MKIKVLTYLMAIIIASSFAFSATPSPQAYFKNELAQGNVQLQIVDKKIVFTVPMAFSELNPSARTRNTLQKIFTYLKYYPSVNIEIEGHTDNVKPRVPETIQKYPDLNAYSLGRAEAVKNLLISFGIKAAQITTKGAGDTKPVAANDNEEGRAKNRRVIITADLGVASIPSEAIRQGEANPPASTQAAPPASTQAAPPASTQAAPQSSTQAAPPASTQAAPQSNNSQPRIEVTPSNNSSNANPPQDNAPARNQ